MHVHLLLHAEQRAKNVPTHGRLSQRDSHPNDCSLVIIMFSASLVFVRISLQPACIIPPCSSPSIGLDQAKIVTRQPLSLERRYLMFGQGIG